MAESRDAVRNAADPEQVKRAGRQDRDARGLYLGALHEVMENVAGRRVMWELLTKAKVFESIMTASAAIYYNSGRQDFGHELLADLIAAHEDGYLLMETEARARAKRQRLGNEAAHTAPVEGA